MTEKNPLIQASDALAPGRFCPAGCDHGGGCSLAPGHDGPHEAHGTGGRILCTWEEEEPTAEELVNDMARVIASTGITADEALRNLTPPKDAS